MALPTLSLEQVRAWRVSHHHLHRRAPKALLAEVVRDTCGIHAQVPSAAELQLWARVDGVKPEDVRAALWDDRTLVRTWSLRGTLHLLNSEDLALYVAALSQHDRWWKGAWLRMIGMSETELRATLDAIRASLGARPLTREQLAEKVAAKVGPKARDSMMSGWGEMLKPAAFHGYLCSGPPRGQSVTFVRPDRWLKRWRIPEASAAWREIVRRYLRAYGPAGREEFARWWGMQPAPAGRVLKAVGDELSEVEIEGRSAWVLTEDLAAIEKAHVPTEPRLLPAFDVYIAGTRPRSSLVEERFEGKVFRQAGWISPVIIVAGQIAGIWKHEAGKKRTKVVVEPFQKLTTKDRRALSEEAEHLGGFLDAPADIHFHLDNQTRPT